MAVLQTAVRDGTDASSSLKRLVVTSSGSKRGPSSTHLQGGRSRHRLRRLYLGMHMGTLKSSPPCGRSSPCVLPQTRRRLAQIALSSSDKFKLNFACVLIVEWRRVSCFSRCNEYKACQFQQDNKGFTFVATGKFKLNFACVLDC